MVCGDACSRLPVRAQPALHSEYPEPFLFAWGFCTCSGAPWPTSSGPLFPSSHALRPRPYRSPPGTRRGRRLSQSLPFIGQTPSFWLGGRASLPYCSTPPLIHRLVFQSFDQTSPLCHPHYPFRNSRSWLPAASGANLEAREQPRI